MAILKLLDVSDTIMDMARAAQAARDEGNIAASIALVDAIFDLIDGTEEPLPTPAAPPPALYALHPEHPHHTSR